MRITTRLAWLAIIPLCALAAVTGLIWLALAAMHHPDGKRAWQLAEAFDRLANAAVGGSSRMTISAHAGQQIRQPWAKALCALLNRVDSNHCQKSWDAYQNHGN